MHHKLYFVILLDIFFPNGTLERIFEFEVPTAPGSTTGVGQGIGFMDLKTIPNDPYGRAYTCGGTVNLMYLIGAGMSQPIAALDVSVVNGYKKRPSAAILSLFPDGEHLLMSFQMRYVILVNIKSPLSPVILRAFDFCSDEELNDVFIQAPDSYEPLKFAQFCEQNNNITGAHVLIHPTGEIRFIVINYFLHFGLAQYSGTRSVHAFKLDEDLNDFHYDKNFNPNFQFNNQETFHSLQAYPHHVQYI